MFKIKHVFYISDLDLKSKIRHDVKRGLHLSNLSNVTQGEESHVRQRLHLVAR